MKKRILSVLLIVLIFLMPITGMICLSFTTPSVYHNTFLAELSDKYERLNTIEGEKIVVIGGSSVAFGLNSEQMEKSLKIPVVNFGLYASLGSKVMLDVAKQSIHSGDIVVLAFEMDNQTLSMYFNAESMWQAVDCDYNLLWKISPDDYGKMAGAFYDYTKNKINFLKNGAPNPDGVYNKASFNEYGDICYPRNKNIMTAGFDSNQIISFSDLKADGDFIEYVNQFIDYVEKKGAKVCFSFSPMNSLAISETDNDQTKAQFVNELKESFSCSFISNLDDYILDSKYFYDTNFHLNDYGTYFRTKQLAEDLSKHYKFDLYDVQQPFEDIDDLTNSNENETEENITESEFADCFTFEDFYGTGFAITGVTEKAKSYKEIEIPKYYNGMKVLAIKPDAFKGCNQLTKITISCDGSDSVTVYDGAFAGLEKLESVILKAKPDNIKVSTSGLMTGVTSDLKFYVNKDDYSSYVTDYYWAGYSEYIKKID